MAYFPFFVNLAGKSGLIAGGGTVALGKARRLLPYGPRLTVAAPEILPELEALPGVEALKMPFRPELLEGRFFVIAATDAPEENRRVAALCKERGILVNAADDREACAFLFPALVRQGELSIGVSTGGASPSAAVWMKERVAAQVPENFGALLEYLAGLRPRVRALVPARRGAVFSRLFDACLENGVPLPEDVVMSILREEEPE